MRRDDFQESPRGTAVAFGRFDGMHLGHREVIRKLASFEHSVLISFEDQSGDVLTTEAEKEYILKSLGVERMISVPADEFEAMALSAFVRELPVGRLGAKTVLVGENYDRLKELREACEENGMALVTVPTVTDRGREVTTALIRSCFLEGDMNECLRLLGGRYVMIGPVVHGKGAGRKHAMPTANLGFAANKRWPVHGVYGTVVRQGGQTWKGMTNIGLRPSDDNSPVPTCETFILGFNGDLYDQTLILEAFTYIRPVLRFRDLDEVREQIDRDIRSIEEKTGPDSV